MQLILALAHVATTVINNLPEARNFAGYCIPVYDVDPTDMAVEKLIVLFRHGDRAPLSTANTLWESESCVECSTKTCRKIPCKDGTLTIKGFRQGKRLGSFIREHYQRHPRVFQKIRAIHTLVGRTRDTLMGVLHGIGVEDTETFVGKSLLLSPECTRLRDTLAMQGQDRAAYERFDGVIASVCNSVPLNCEKLNCDLLDISQTIEAELSSYTSLMGRFRTSLELNALEFSGLAMELAGMVNDGDGMMLMAAHDSSISKMLNGLNVGYNGIPPYASAVFIEVLEDGSGGRFVRGFFEGENIRFGGKKQPSVDQFTEYLSIFGSKHEKLQKICGGFDGSQDKEHFRSEILGLFGDSGPRSQGEDGPASKRVVSAWFFNDLPSFLDVMRAVLARVSMLFSNA